MIGLRWLSPFERGAVQLFGPGLVIAVYTVLFWSLRIKYWSVTHEAPFSDIADYVAVGQNIAHHFFFGENEAQVAYFTPVTPSFIAVSMILGGAHFETVFRIIVQSVAFAGSLVLAYEILKLTGRGWLAAAWLLLLALSKPSIFWSLKLGTEAVSEALLISSIGLVLRAIRTGSLVGAGFAGAVCLLLALNRPQFMPAILIAGVFWGCASVSSRGKKPLMPTPSRPVRMRLRDPARLLQAACFGLGVALAWSPWIVRNYVNYGAFVPTGTSGNESIIWEYGGAPIKITRYRELRLPDGSSLAEFGLDKIRERLASVPNDVARAPKIREYAIAWIMANIRDIPRLTLWHLKQLISERGANGLTKVSRTELFSSPTPGYSDPMTKVAWLNLFLIDKTPWICLLAFAGALILAMRYGLPGAMIICIWVIPWLSTALVIGYERAVESMISFGLWLALYAVVAVTLFLSRRSQGKADI